MDIIKVIGYKYGIAAPHWPACTCVHTNRLYHIFDGTGGYEHNGEKGEFDKGKLYFIPYSENYTCYTDKDNPILHTYIDFDIIPPVATKKLLCAQINDDPMLLSALKVFDDGGKYFATGTLLLEDYNDNTILKNLCNSAVLYILSYIMKENNIPVISDEKIIRALDIIHTRMSEPITVEMLADTCGMNKDSFIRRFNRVMNTTPYAYLKNLRIRTAMRLREEGMRLSDIAKQTGYSDTSSLLHAMK